MILNKVKGYTDFDKQDLDYKHNKLIQRYAGKIIQKDIRNGLLSPINTQLCIHCNKQAEQYHHYDYPRPHNVIPLCIKCHNKVHKKVFQNKDNLSIEGY